MSDSFEFTLHSPLTKEDWNTLSDAELENTTSVTFQTPQGRQVRYIKSEVLDKIRIEIWDLQYGDEEKSMSDEDRADAYNNAIRQVIEIIDKYKGESEVKDDNCAGNDQNA